MSYLFATGCWVDMPTCVPHLLLAVRLGCQNDGFLSRLLVFLLRLSALFWCTPRGAQDGLFGKPTRHTHVIISGGRHRFTGAAPPHPPALNEKVRTDWPIANL